MENNGGKDKQNFILKSEMLCNSLKQENNNIKQENNNLRQEILWLKNKLSERECVCQKLVSMQRGYLDEIHKLRRDNDSLIMRYTQSKQHNDLLSMDNAQLKQQNLRLLGAFQGNQSWQNQFQNNNTKQIMTQPKNLPQNQSEINPNNIISVIEKSKRKDKGTQTEPTVANTNDNQLNQQIDKRENFGQTDYEDPSGSQITQMNQGFVELKHERRQERHKHLNNNNNNHHLNNYNKRGSGRGDGYH